MVVRELNQTFDVDDFFVWLVESVFDVLCSVITDKVFKARSELILFVSLIFLLMLAHISSSIHR